MSGSLSYSPSAKMGSPGSCLRAGARWASRVGRYSEDSHSRYFSWKYYFSILMMGRILKIVLMSILSGLTKNLISSLNFFLVNESFTMLEL